MSRIDLLRVIVWGLMLAFVIAAWVWIIVILWRAA